MTEAGREDCEDSDSIHGYEISSTHLESNEFGRDDLSDALYANYLSG